MSYKEFRTYFDLLEICNLSSSSVPLSSASSTYYQSERILLSSMKLSELDNKLNKRYEDEVHVTMPEPTNQLPNHNPVQATDREPTVVQPKKANQNSLNDDEVKLERCLDKTCDWLLILPFALLLAIYILAYLFKSIFV